MVDQNEVEGETKMEVTKLRNGFVNNDEGCVVTIRCGCRNLN